MRVKNGGNIKRICIGLQIYAATHDGAMPQKLQELAEMDILADQRTYLWIHPVTGKTTPYIYFPGFPFGGDGAEEIIVIAAPEAVDGRRACGFADGHGETAREERVREMLKHQGSQLPAAQVKPEDIPADIRAQVAALVEQLGAREPGTRAQARKALEALGDTALPALMLHRNHDDPEVRMTVRDLLGE